MKRMTPFSVAMLCGIVLVAFAEFGRIPATLVLLGAALFAVGRSSARPTLYRAGIWLLLLGGASGLLQKTFGTAPAGRGPILEVSPAVLSIPILFLALTFVGVFLLFRRFADYIEASGLKGDREEVRRAVLDLAPVDLQADRAWKAQKVGEVLFAGAFVAIGSVALLEALLGSGWEPSP
ncbi:MAG: hypothetical protein AAF919_05525 [Pseudomonadota bacterium]